MSDQLSEGRFREDMFGVIGTMMVGGIACPIVDLMRTWGGSPKSSYSEAKALSPGGEIFRRAWKMGDPTPCNISLVNPHPGGY